ncbi:outer membrane phosphoporin protein E, partial [Salmonella enterica subsp. enterica serovar Heidelberg str. 607310-1]
MISAAAILPSAALILSPIAPGSKIWQRRGTGDKAEAWATGVKYDANDIYIATFYSETRNMTPVSGGFANKTQNFE